MENETVDQEPRHPIRVVSERTGLSPDVLRAWEKRYAAVQPPRREGAGQRLYSDADVERLRLLRRVTQAGRSIGQVAELSTEELASLAREDEAQRTAALVQPRVDGRPSRPYLDRALREARALDASALEAVLRRAVVALRNDEFIDEVAVPFLVAVGEEWEAGTMGVAHEHMSSVVMRRVLGRIAETAEPDRGAPELVVATPARQVHELGALLVAATAAAGGWRVTVLGADLPAEEIASAARQRDANAVALSIIYPSPQAELSDELRRLRRELPAHVPVIVGGAGSRRLWSVLDEEGITFLPTLGELRRALAHMLSHHAHPHTGGRNGGGRDGNGNGNGRGAYTYGNGRS